MGLRRFALLLTLAALLAPAPCRGDEAEPSPRRHRLHFAPDYRRFSAAEYVGTAAVGGVGLALQFAVQTPVRSRSSGPILFDRAVRDGIVASTPAGRNRAILVGDLLWYAPMALPFAESALLPLLTDGGNWDVAWQLTAMNLQAAAVNWVLTRSGHRFIARARPDTGPCLKDPHYSGACFSGVNDSFPSGHTSAAMMGAALTCVHHANLPLYGGNAADAVVCAATVAMALGSGTMRMVGDRHYISDVLVGALLGAGTGLGLPVLLHYGRFGDFAAPADGGTALLALPFATADSWGVMLSGKL